MAIHQQLKGLFKIEFIEMKRNICLSLVEILCPIILILLFLFLRLAFKTKKEKYESIFENDLDFIAHYSTNLTNHITSKEQNKIEKLDEKTPLPYYYFLAQCQFTKHIAIIGEDFPQKLIDKIASHFWELDDDLDKDVFFLKYKTKEDFEKYITSKEYGTNEILFPKICFGISKIDKFKFRIHYNTINIDNENSDEVEDLLAQESPHIPEMKSNKNEKIRTQENLKFFTYYKNSGYLMTMKIIYDYILQEITNNPEAEINFSVIGMKYDEILKDNFHRFLSILGFFIIIGYSIPFSINIYKEIHFRETKKKEYLKSMGVKEILLFICSFIRCFIINIFQSIFCALFAKIILTQSQYIYLFLIFLLFGLVIFSMIYFFQSFLQESRMGVIISLLIYCIMSFLYLPISSPAVNKSFAYFICILFPTANMLLGINNFFIFEKEFSPLNNRVNLDVSQITISLMIIFLFINFIIYLILGFIISQFFCYEFGVNKNKCCCSKKKSTGYFNNISNPPKNEENNNEKPKNKTQKIINTNNINNINNINININIHGNIQDNFQGLGQKYIENDDMDISEQKSIDEINQNPNNNKDIKLEKEELKKKIKYMGYDYINSLSKNAPKKILEMKKENLKKSLRKIRLNNIEEDETNPHFLEDDFEMDLDNQKELQEMRNNRRLKESTIYNLKPEEYHVNQNLKISTIGFIVEDPFLTKSVIQLFGDNLQREKNFNDVKLEKNEIKKEEEDCHFGSRLEIKNMKKSYDERELILDNLSFNLYENEIYALLGQNGTGKSTFISILSGLIEPNSGSIKYKIDKDDIGLEVTNPQGNEQFRKILGVCHQNNNILYDDLTVKENLEIFCLLKYDKKKFGSDETYHIDSEVIELLDKFELRDDQNKLSKNLSGGLKRRLCIAIASCGRSKVIILDEPTGGIDIISRKKLMNILQKLKNDNKIILLITHFMEEASFLADNIGILKNGSIISSGTSRELIENNGKYITIQINKRVDKRTKELIKYIKENIVLKDVTNSDESKFNSFKNNNTNKTNSFLIKNKQMEIKIYKERIEIKIPTKLFNFSKSSDLLKTIEIDYKINDYRIVQDQLEDAFINAIRDKSNKDDNKDYLTLSEIDQFIQRFDIFEKFKNELKILIFKRGYETLRDKKSFILEIIFPLLLTLIACFVSYFEALEDNRTSSIELYNFSNDTQSIYYEFSNVSHFTKYYNLLVEDARKEKNKIKNYHFYYIKNEFSQENYTILQNYIAYLNFIYGLNKNRKIFNNSAAFYLINADDENHKYEFASFISFKQRHASIVYSNYVLRNIIRYEMKNNPQYKSDIDNIEITNSPFLLGYEEINDKKSRNGFVLAFYVSIALSLIPANFITIIIREKENKCKHLQLLSGLSIYTYWINNYIFELIKYYVVVGICLIILAIFKFYEKYLAVLYLFYGPALVSFTYVISYFIEYEGVGQIVVLLINLIFGSLGSSAILILRTNKDMKKLGIVLSYFFRFVPSFCINYGFSQLVSKKALFAIDYFTNIEDYELFQKKLNDSSTIIKDGKYIMNDIIFLVLEIFLYTGLLIFLEKKDFFLWKLGFIKNKLENEYPEIYPSQNYSSIQTSEREISVNQSREQYNPLEIHKLKKSYKDKKYFFNCCKKRKPILSNVSFNVKNGECFGLLGSNGQGKTTAFKCLCQEEKPDGGIIKINNIDIYDQTIKEKPNVGYCPQFDSIFEFLTVKENLKYYGKLKGISGYTLDNIIEIIIKKLNLQKFSDRLSGQLSGGNKRKLSVGISIICKPCVIFLDEPSTGMDPYTRRLLLLLLHRAYLRDNPKKPDKSPRSIVLTTHSIEEAEALCDKIGILVGGKFDVKGRISEILQKKSKGVELNIEFKKPSPEYLQKKYGDILAEIIKDENGIKEFLNSINKNHYIKFLEKKHFGKDILKVISSKKKINKFSILRWVEYLNFLLDLVNKIKNYFASVHCVQFKLNNFILLIKNNQENKRNDNHLFGIIEQYREILFIEEYTYSLTTLESIFIECNETKENYKRNLNNIEGNNYPVYIEL